MLQKELLIFQNLLQSSENDRARILLHLMQRMKMLKREKAPYVLLNLANMHSVIVVGTGDLSEIALGFATYSGDHIAHYSVNAGIPKHS